MNPRFTALLRAPWGRVAALGALLLSGPAALAQLSGTYTINDAQATGGTNYASFAAAATALNTNGVSGPVTFNVSGGPYTEQLRLQAVVGTSATNRITINGNGRTIQYNATVLTEPAVVTLNGTDYVTLNNLTVVATGGGTGSYGWGIQLVNNADNDAVSNCTVTCGVTFNCAGIVSSGSASNMTGTGATTNQNLSITNNTVTGGYYGITAVGNSTTAPTPGIVISNNTVRDFNQYGLYVGYVSAPQLIGNDVARPNATSVSSYYGIYLTSGVSGAAVEKNRLHTPFAAGATNSAAFAIYVNTTTAATAAAPNDVVNNLVYDMVTTGSTYGIYNVSSAYCRYYHNTVDLDMPANTSGNSAYGFYQLTGANVEFKNNVVRVNRGGTAPQYAIYQSLGTTGSTVSDYNDLNGQGLNFITGYTASTAYPTLAAWQAATGGPYDLNSTAAEPGFENRATGNLRPTASPLDGRATPLARVPQDVTGATRSTTAPDMGAYEFTAPALDVALLRIDAPASPAAVGSGPVTVTVLNNGSTALTSVRLEYVLNNGTLVAQTFALSPALAPGATTSLSFSTTATLAAGASTLTVTASLPNGQADSNATNNSRTTTVYTALRGTYTINQQLPTGGTNFASFADAATRLNGGGISGPVRLNVLNGPYQEAFVLGVVPGVSATDTLVVDGGSAKQTISFAGTASQQTVVSLLDTDYVTLQNLTIDGSGGTTFSNGVQLVGAAENNRIQDCNILVSSTLTSGSFGIVALNPFGALVPPGNANNLRLERNVISGGYGSIQINGLSTTNRVAGLRISGNDLRDFYQRGIELSSSTGARLLANNISRPTRTSNITTFYGIYCIGNVSTAIERNRIHDPFTTTVTTGAYGIYYINNSGLAGQENDAVNNIIYNFNAAGQDYGIYNASSSYCRYYHNTISFDNTANAGSINCYGFYQVTASTNIDFRNNLISITRGGTGSRYALYFSTTTSSILSDYNDLYLGTGTGFYTGYYSTNQATLANWQAVNSSAYDQHSFQTNPQFTAAATGNLLPTAIGLDASGTSAVLTRVPRDIVGVQRGSTPDVGAFELTVVANDVAVVSIDAPVTPAVLGANPVTVTIRNGGTAVLTSVTLAYAINNGATPATNQQTFSGLSLAAGATQQLTFSTGVTLTQTTSYTLTVTGSLPNGQPDGNAANNTQTVTFDQPQLLNDEPCGAVALTGQVSSTNANATTSIGGGLANALPTCAGSQAPKDVWFTFTPSSSSFTLYTSGTAAGTVRVFSATSCSAGFAQVFCRASAGSNQNVGNVAITGLTAGQRYYLAVSGYSSNDAGGPFTLGLSPLSTRSALDALVRLYPNPVTGGEFTLEVQGLAPAAGTVALYNALGQTVRTQALAAGTQQLATRGLAPGLYTLRVQQGTDVLLRKVVVE
ncbi:T9SS type A sorting domain-containing protein [Microvirga sp. STS02]|uniref:beta strand repeat-containing protein n=1 Tax=Hymenobacter negativus TaxID=2795026 RepID=UPI0018DE87BD|nr:MULTISPECIES: CARDB domain-containing protein [Bacteria]MBH8569043.1 T9SS type A sorting domain-containing protein [Hymenobacter negativus]MBR7208778.1 T9SS type A sorting domain-containing protein [Microvirga sp. STS02]